jgi:hypothetical protein
VGEHRRPAHVTDRADAVGGRLDAVVGLDEPPVVE